MPEKSLLEALKNRYGAKDDIDDYDPSAFLVGDPSKVGARNKTWNLVGMEKIRAQQSRYDRLFVVVLRDEDISVALTEEEEKKVFNGIHHAPVKKGTVDKSLPTHSTLLNALEAENMVRLEELDLSANPRLPLREVGKLMPYFTQLKVLQLSDIPSLLPSVSTALAAVADQSQPAIAPLLSSPQLEKLVLNNIGVKSIAALKLWIDTPNLTELHLDHNQLSALPVLHTSELAEEEGASEEHLLDRLMLILSQRQKEVVDGASSVLSFPSIRTLNLAYNCFSSWGSSGQSSGEGLGLMLHHAFPSLERLFLTGNQLPDISLPPTDGQPLTSIPDFAFLGPLQLLCVRENCTITSTHTIEALRQLAPHLKTFRISYDSLLSEWNETLARMYVVASLPTITLLNRGQIREKERLDSEIFYIQRGRAWRERRAKEMWDEPIAYPLLEQLEEKHKEVVMSIYQEGMSASEDGLVGHIPLSLTFYPENLYRKKGVSKGGASTAQEATKAVQMTVPSNITVGKLKALVRASFGVEPPHQLLKYQPGGDKGVMDLPIELDNENETLGYFGVTNNGKIGVTDTSLR